MTQRRAVFRRNFLKAIGAASALTTQVQGVAGQTDPAVYVEESERVRIGNANLELAFRRGNGGIAEFIDKQGGGNLRTKASTPALSWGLKFYSKEYDNLMTASYMAGRPTIETKEDASTASVKLRWSDPELKAPPHGRLDDPFAGTIEVTVSIEAGDSVSCWDFQVTNNDDRAIKQTICPELTNIEPLVDDGSDALYIPSRLGRKYPDPTELDHSPVHRYPSGHGTMQFVAYLANEAGIYAAAEDTEGYAKRLEFMPRGGTLGYRATHLVPYAPGEDVEVPYAMVIGIQSGGWRSVCDRYRSWVESEGWLADASSKVPDRLRQRGVSYHERSYSRSALEDGDKANLSFDTIESMVSNVQDILDVPMGFRWWGWSKHGFPAVGDWLPPYEGLDKFESVVSTLQESDVNTIVMLNPTFLLESSDYWASLDSPSDLPIRTREGSIRRYTANNEEITLAKLSPLIQPWQDHYRSVLDQLEASGISHVDLDGLPWQWTPDCWNEAHNHPPGKGGNWFTQRLRQLYEDVHTSRDIDGELALGGEGIADFYLPYLNVHASRDGMAEFDDPSVERGTAEVIPMFPYTFGDYATTRSQKGHIGDFAEQRDIQRLIAGRAIEWGSIPIFMGHYDPAPGSYDEAVLDYYAQIGSARHGYANRFLGRGEMLSRPKIDRRRVTISQRGVETSTEEIRGSGWRSPEGDLGVVLTNVSNREESRTISLDLSQQPFELPQNPLVYVVRNGEYRAIGGVDVSLTLQPSDVGLVAAIPTDSKAKDALAQIKEAQKLDGVDVDVLSEAKRAFDSHNYNKATQKAADAVSTVENTATDTETNTMTEMSAEGSDSGTTPGGEGPGFGAGGGIAGIVGGVLGGWLLHDNGSDESEDRE